MIRKRKSFQVETRVRARLCSQNLLPTLKKLELVDKMMRQELKCTWQFLIVAGMMALGVPAFADVINSGAAGLEAPEDTIDFLEHTFADTTVVSTEFADLGVVFLPHLVYRTESNPDWAGTGVTGPNLRTGEPEANPFSLLFVDTITSAAFISIAAPPTPATITAKLDGVDVESFSTTFGLYENSNHWYGFTDVELNEIEIAYTAETRLRIDNVQLGTVVGQNADPDFDVDGDLDEDDVDLLVNEIVAGGNDSFYDISRDGIVDNTDLTQWLTDAANANGFADPYLLGDANLSGMVDVSDLNSLGLSWQQDVPKWSAGDFNASGTVDASDLNEIGINWQQSIPLAAAQSVPEPSGIQLLYVAGLLAVVSRFKNSSNKRCS